MIASTHAKFQARRPHLREIGTRAHVPFRSIPGCQGCQNCQALSGAVRCCQRPLSYDSNGCCQAAVRL
eukprot:3904370-Prymnesium_polylepis.1